MENKLTKPDIGKNIGANELLATMTNDKTLANYEIFEMDDMKMLGRVLELFRKRGFSQWFWPVVGIRITMTITKSKSPGFQEGFASVRGCMLHRRQNHN